jgi:hypothetical protein
MWWYCDLVEGHWHLSVDVFVLLTGGASFDVFFHPGLHGRPPGDVQERVEGPVSPRMSSCWFVVNEAYQVSLQLVVRGYDHFPFFRP